MAYFKDLREFIAEVQRRGRLHTFTRPVNKETELMPLFRVMVKWFMEPLSCKTITTAGYCSMPRESGPIRLCGFARQNTV